MDALAFPDTSCRFPAGEELMSTLGLKESRSCPGEGGERGDACTPFESLFYKQNWNLQELSLGEWPQSNRESFTFFADLPALATGSLGDPGL